MSWLSRKKASVTNLKAAESVHRSTTPTPGNPTGLPLLKDVPNIRSGLLAIRVLWAEGLALPAGITLPKAVQSALSSQQAKVAASVSPSSVTQQRLAKNRGNRCVFVVIGSFNFFYASRRNSIQRTQCWWLPYLVVEYEVNQVLITPLGGELDKPLYMYQAHL